MFIHGTLIWRYIVRGNFASAGKAYDRAIEYMEQRYGYMGNKNLKDLEGFEEDTTYTDYFIGLGRIITTRPHPPWLVHFALDLKRKGSHHI